ncbi:hypothetical protein B0H12DRAFT_1076191 [Mycena haematopus]|nr:hypothetical protein B0H12DRAFT_1076191 [Mycena haematopus]
MSAHFLTLLQPAFCQWSASSVFRPYSRAGQSWGHITFHDTSCHLASSALHWKKQLGSSGVSSGEVVGMWLTGTKYDDLINILGVSAAGYVPQLFSQAFSNPSVVRDLLSSSNAKALILDVPFVISEIVTLPALTLTALSDLVARAEDHDYSIATVDERDDALVVHSSGTTSARPKLIRTTHGWISAYIKYKYSLCQGPLEGRNVTNTIGNLAYVASITTFLAAIYRGYCTAQSPALDMTTEQLMAMIKTCGLNRMALYAMFLSVHIKAAQEDRVVLEALQAFRQIVHTGVSLNPEEEEWAHVNHLPITTLYVTSETGSMMTTVLGNAPADRLLRLLPGGSGALIPYSLIEEANLTLTEESESESLWEMVVPAGAPDSPHPSLISEDNLYHTRDLFEQMQPGLYHFRGRTGDMLKTVYGFCDTKAIKDNVRRTCDGLIHDVVVVGKDHNRPALFVEIADGAATEEEKQQLSVEIVERMRAFNQGLFPHERIEDPSRIRILPKGSLPRTKNKGSPFLSAGVQPDQDIVT